jgi:histidinol-phosphate aminotransferase
MTSIIEKGRGSFEGVKLLLCENPLPPIEEAMSALSRQSRSCFNAQKRPF